jgi:hypothetical protein
MFGDISNDETDHWNPIVTTPLYQNPNKKRLMLKTRRRSRRSLLHDWSYREAEEEIQEVSPSIANKKTKAHIVLEIPMLSQILLLSFKKTITKIVDSASSFA